jgi:hypothetical protein
MSHIAAFIGGMVASVAVIAVTLAVRYHADTSSNERRWPRTHEHGQASVYRRSTQFGRSQRPTSVQGWK